MSQTTNQLAGGITTGVSVNVINDIFGHQMMINNAWQPMTENQQLAYATVIALLVTWIGALLTARFAAPAAQFTLPAGWVMAPVEKGPSASV